MKENDYYKLSTVDVNKLFDQAITLDVNKLFDQAIVDIIRGDVSSYIETTFPFEFPVSHNNIKLGTIKIEFDYKKEKLSKDKMLKKMDIVHRFLEEFSAFWEIFEKSIKLSFNIWDKYKKEIRHLDSLISLSGDPVVKVGEAFETMTSIRTFFFVKEDKMFELIREAGPIALCNPFVQDLIIQWLFDKKRSEGRMTKLRKSLLDYTGSLSKSDKKNKKRGPKEETKTRIIKKLGKEEFKDIYQQLIKTFRIVKANKGDYIKDNISEFFEQVSRDHTFSQKEEIEKSQKPEDKRLYKILKKQCEILEEFKHLKFYGYITDYIESDEDLKKKFESFKWEPNVLAKVILAKILGPGYHSIESKLDRKNTL